MDKVIAGSGWSSASLRVFSETFHPDEIAAALGLKATDTHLKGEKRGPRSEAQWRESLWSLRSPIGDDHGVAEHLKWLLDSLEPKLEAIKTLSGKCRVDLFCGFSSESGQGGLTLDAEILKRLARLEIPLILDLYPWNDEGKAGASVLKA